MEFIRRILQRCGAAFYRFAAYSIAFLLPARMWYGAAFTAIRIQIWIIYPLALLRIYPYRHDVKAWSGRKKLIAARFMESWLKRISEHHRPFPIPIRIRGGERLEELSASGTGMVFCSIHTFLADTGLRAIAQRVNDLSVISRVHSPENGYPIWGMGRTIPAIDTDENVLLRARRILRRGGSIIVLIDEGMAQPLHSNILRLASRVGARLAVGIPELQANGEILIEGFIPPLCDGDEAIRMTLEVLQAERNRILQISPSTSGCAEERSRRRPLSAAPDGQ